MLRFAGAARRLGFGEAARRTGRRVGDDDRRTGRRFFPPLIPLIPLIPFIKFPNACPVLTPKFEDPSANVFKEGSATLLPKKLANSFNAWPPRTWKRRTGRFARTGL